MAIGLAAILNSCTCSRPKPPPALEPPLPTDAWSKDGKLHWVRTEHGFSIEGMFNEREGRFEYVSESQHGPLVRASTYENNFLVVGYDGYGSTSLDGWVNRAEVNPIGIIVDAEDGKQPEAQGGFSKEFLTQLHGAANSAYRDFCKHIQTQFDSRLVKIAWEHDPGWNDEKK